MRCKMRAEVFPHHMLTRHEIQRLVWKNIEPAVCRLSGGAGTGRSVN